MNGSLRQQRQKLPHMAQDNKRARFLKMWFIGIACQYSNGYQPLRLAALYINGVIANHRGTLRINAHTCQCCR